MPVLLAYAIEDSTDIFRISGGVWTPTPSTPLIHKIICFKLQKKAVRLICNVKRKTSCREVFRTLIIQPVPCVHIMETVYYIKLNNEGLKQILAIHDHKTQHRSNFQTQFCRTDIFKKSVNNLGTKLYNKLPNYLKNLKNLKILIKQLEAFLLQQTFYSVDEYWSYV